MAFAAILMLAGTTNSWALLGLEKVSYDGSLETVGVSANNEVQQNNKAALSDHRGETNTRVRLGIDADVTEGVVGRVEFGRTNSTYGRSYAASNASNSIDNETANILINNAYVDLADLLSLNVRLGRQYVGNDNDLVWNISPRKGDALAINAIDGLLLGKKWAMAEASLFMGKAVKEDPQGSTNLNLAVTGDVNLNSLDIIIPKVLPNGKINVGYLWGVQTSVSPRNSLNTARLGVSGGVLENMVTYQAEYLMNTGANNFTGTKVKYEGTAIDLGVGYNAPETSIGKFSANIGYVMASGDNNTTDNKDKAFHDFGVLGVASSDRYFGEIFSKSDVLAVGQVGVNSPAQGQGLKVLTLGVEYFPKWVNNTNAKLAFYDVKMDKNGASALSTAKDVGQEWDLSLGYKVSDNVGISGGYAMLQPDKGIVGTVPGTKKDDITKLFARASIKWGSNK